MTYAAATSVPVERSRAEIERILTRYGATRFASGWDERGALIGFVAKDRRVRFHLPLPSRSEKRFTHQKPRSPYSDPQRRTEQAALAAWEQECRSRWRSLVLSIKAKLEAVESGIETFEEAFLAHVVMPDGRTVAQSILPAIADSYAQGVTVPLLGDGT